MPSPYERRRHLKTHLFHSHIIKSRRTMCTQLINTHFVMCLVFDGRFLYLILGTENEWVVLRTSGMDQEEVCEAEGILVRHVFAFGQRSEARILVEVDKLRCIQYKFVPWQLRVDFVRWPRPICGEENREKTMESSMSMKSHPIDRRERLRQPCPL